MSRTSAWWVVAALVAAGCWVDAAWAAESAAAGKGEVTALVGGRLIDGFGGPPLENSVVLVEGGKIAAVGQVGTLAVPKNAKVISTDGMSVMPGLFDMHVHLMLVGHADYPHWDKVYPPVFESEIMPAAARQLLHAGVTSARDLGAPLAEILAVRKAIDDGVIEGPSLYVSGPFIQKAPYPGTEAFRWGVDGAADARAKVKKLADAGVDVIKLIDQDQMTDEEYHAVVEEAHAHGLPVVAHSHRAEEIRRGIKANVDCFEHTGLGTTPEYPADIYDLIKSRANNLYWTPTVAPLLLYGETRENPERLDDPRWHQGLKDATVADVRQSLDPVQEIDYFHLVPRREPTVARKFQQLRDAGVLLLIGTDAGVPMTFHSDATWRELAAWVGFGVPAMDAIRAATYWPARSLKILDRVGTISVGKDADIIAVRGDVLKHIDLLQDVDLVMKRGKRVK